jgi:hypothetical protein
MSFMTSSKDASSVAVTIGMVMTSFALQMPGSMQCSTTLRRADQLILFGLILLGSEPVLILFAIRLTGVALAAFALWVVGIVIISKNQQI